MMAHLDLDDPLNEQQKKSKVLNLGIAFCVLFTAYNVSQSFLTTLYGDIGYICLSFIYLFMTLGSFITPYVYDNLGIKKSFVFSSMTYALFVACTGLKSNIAMITSSICLGLGGSLLWLTQGNYLTLVADGSSFGTLNGLFHSVHSINNIIGTITTDTLPLILTALAIGGVLLFTRVSPVEHKSPQTILNISERIHNMLFIAKQEKMLLLFGSMIYQGMSLSLMNGVAPTLVGTKYIPFLFLVYGVCRMTGSYFWGKIYDNYSWKILWVGNFIFAASAFGSIYMAYQIESGESGRSYFWIMMYFGAAMGFAESCVTALINSTLMEFFSATSNSAFAVYRFVTSLATSMAFFFTPKCSLETLEMVSFSMLVLATLSFYHLRNTK